MNIFKKENLTKTIAVLGMLIAITFIMVYTFLGTIPLGTVEATIAHLPTIIGSIILGPLAGAILGLAMGIISMIYVITQPTQLLSPFIANPLVSVLPRIFIGIVAYLCYALVKKLSGNKGEVPAIIVGTAMGSVTNTVGVLAMLYILYGNDVMNAMASAGIIWQSAMVGFVGIAMTNGVAEMTIIAILGTAIILALKKARLR